MKSGDPPRYRLRRLLGRGGMAEVFEAQVVADGGVARRVAIKRLLANIASDDATGRMFLDEATIASKLHHGSIVALLDYGVHEGQPFQVLEFVDGLDASELAKRGDRAEAPMPPEIALHIAVEVAHALDYAHRATSESGEALEVVHRDVKPSNILVSWSGDVKLADFGVAFARDRSERTTDGSAKGTPSYMSPEQTRGLRVDGRSDIFALGCALHALVTGLSPVRLDGNLGRLIAGEELALDPALDPAISAIVAKATRWHPEERYTSASEMAEAAGELLARRIQTSPRTRLIAWLARIRETAPERAPRGGRLDALLDLDLVLAPSMSPATRREFVTVTPETRRDPRPAVDAPVAPAPSPSAGRRAWLPWVTSAAAIGAVLGGLRLVTARASSTRNDLEVSAAVSAPPAAPPTPTAGGELEAPAGSVAPPGSAAAAAPLRAARPTAARSAAPALASSAARSSAPEPREPAATGMLVIRGAGSVGAQIQIDGVPRGLAPKMLEVPVGAHTVSLVLPTGESLGARRVVVGESNTRTSPAAWDVPAR